MILVGFAEEVVVADDMQECFDLCLNAEDIFQFRCSSGMFFSDEPDLSCVLNSEDSRTQPGMFIPDTEAPVEYFEINCGTILQSNIPTYINLYHKFSMRKLYTVQFSPGNQKSLRQDKHELP